MGTLEWIKNLHTADGLRQLIQIGGLPILTAIIFAETGILLGFFLPGDSLLVTAGIFASTDGAGGDPLFNVWLLLFALTLAAIIGDQLGYYLGRKTGFAAFQKEDSALFKKRHLIAAQNFYEKYGGKAIILARFVPIARTFVPFVAGIAQMDYTRFIRFNVIGGILWVWSLIWLGYGLGQTPLGEKLHFIILVVVFISVLPLIFGALRAYLMSRKKTSVP